MYAVCKETHGCHTGRWWLLQFLFSIQGYLGSHLNDILIRMDSDNNIFILKQMFFRGCKMIELSNIFLEMTLLCVSEQTLRLPSKTSLTR